MRSLNPLTWGSLLTGRASPAADQQQTYHAVQEMPDSFRPMEHASGHARVTGPCGDTMAFWLLIEDGRVVKATYVTDGCWTSIASGAGAAGLAEGRSVDEADRIEQQDVLEAVGGLPRESQHCALLAANTLKAAIADYRGKMAPSYYADTYLDRSLA